MRRIATLAVGALLVALAAAVAEPLVVLQAHRLVQFENPVFGQPLNADKHGSAKAALRGTIARDPAGPLHRSAPLVLSAADLVAVEDKGALLERAEGGVVLLLPDAAAMTGAVAKAVRDLEVAAVKGAAAGAVYAVPASANATAMAAALAAGAPLQMLAAADAPAARTADKSSKVAVLAADAVRAPNGKGQVVAVVAGLDSLGAFPSLPQPNSAADAAMLVELAYLFGGQSHEAGGTGLTFLLGTGDRHSYAGLKAWAGSAEASAAVARFDTVVCLEGAAGAAPASWRLSTARDPAKDKALRGVAAAFGDLKVATAPIDASTSELRWAHEVFAHKGIAAATLTANGAKRQGLRNSITHAAASAETIKTAVDAAAKALATLTGAAPKGEADAARIGRTLRAILADEARPTYDMPAAALSGAQAALNAAIAVAKPAKPVRVRRSEFPFAPPEATFYGPDRAVLTVYATKPPAFEWCITAAIVGALGLAAVALLGPAEAAKIFSKRA